MAGVDNREETLMEKISRAQWTITKEQVQIALDEYSNAPGRLFAAAMGAQEFINHLLASVTLAAPPAPPNPPAKKKRR